MATLGHLIDAVSRAFGTTIYVRFDAKRIHATNPQTLAEFNDSPVVALRGPPNGAVVVAAVGHEAEALSGPDIRRVNPFAHARVVIHEFEIAQALFRYVLQRVLPPRSLLRPHALIQPLRALQGGISDVEERALIEAIVAAGARSGSLHIGSELSPEQVLLASARRAKSPAA
jgi:actin-like ATPase involved in cell morphogenesis